MEEERSIHRWTLIAAVTLLLSTVVFAFVARKPLCIDSKVVEKVDSVKDGKIATAYRCGLHRHVEYEQTIAENSRDLGRRLQKLERFFDWLGALDSKVYLTINSDQPKQYHVQGHELYVGIDVLKSNGQIEKGIIDIWLKEKLSNHFQNNLLAMESLGDFFYFILNGNLDIENPISKTSLMEDAHSNWPQVLSSTAGVCRSLWVPSPLINFCADTESIKLPNDSIDPMSTRALLSQSLIGAYSRLKGNQRPIFLSQFLAVLPKIDLESFALGKSSISLDRQSYIDAATKLNAWSLMLGRISPHFSMLFGLELKSRGFEIEEARADIDLIVFDSSKQPNIRGSIEKDLMKMELQSLVGFVDSENVQLGVGGELLPIKLFGDIRSRIGVYVHCGQLEHSKLIGAISRVQRLLVLNTCVETNLKISGYLKKGIQQFAIENQKVKFIEFHSSSFLAALTKLPDSSPYLALIEMKKDQGLLKFLGWNEPQFDSSANAYRAESNIEAISWYRL